MVVPHWQGGGPGRFHQIIILKLFSNKNAFKVNHDDRDRDPSLSPTYHLGLRIFHNPNIPLK
jgi:hypothetical protein